MRPIRVKMPAAGYPAAFALGAVLGTLWDRMHAVAGALFYTGTTHTQPWWVPVEFGIAGVGVVLGVIKLGDALPSERAPRRALGEILWFTILYALTALLWKNAQALTIVLAVLLVLRTGTLQEVGRSNVVPAVALVIGGPALEAVLSALKLFHYAQPDFARIPLWLPILYMNAVPFVVKGTEALLWITRPRRKTPEGGQGPALLPNGDS
jgi:hypothetical protein